VYIENQAKISEFVWNRFIKNKPKRDILKLLDVGCGEGFLANYFLSKGWEIIATDFSSFGVDMHNISVSKYLIKGDMCEILDRLMKKRTFFDLINYSNVLEHVIDPELSLAKIRALMKKHSLLRIVVPNDFSDYQIMLKEKGLTNGHWFSPPEHLNYFSVTSLKNLLKAVGLEVIDMHGDFPIEIFLSNENSNYVLQKEKGSFAHSSRLIISNFLIAQSGIEKYVNYTRSGLLAGLSRSIIAYVKKCQ
jgi:SAM-dependent methyltransferase